MGIFFTESFDASGTNNDAVTLNKWDSANQSNIVTTTGRTNNGWKPGDFSGQSVALTKTIGGNLATVYVGMAVKVGSGRTA